MKKHSGSIPFAAAVLATAASLAGSAAGAQGGPEKKAPPRTQQQPAVQKAKDPVCGMEVDPKTAEKSSYMGKTYYFCSREEKQEFDKTPDKFVKK